LIGGAFPPIVFGMNETEPYALDVPFPAIAEGSAARSDAFLSPAEEAEVSEILSRIDRELPILEARVDRLLRLYNL
jgi:hypothetical protein